MKTLFVAAIIALAATPLAAQDGGRAAPRIHVAESPLCPKAYENAAQCYRNWKSIGGGLSGQALSFHDCAKVYCDAMIAGGCAQRPPGCNEL